MKTFKEFLNEANKNVTINISDSREANILAKDIFRGEYTNSVLGDKETFVFKKADAAQEFRDELDAVGIVVY